MKLLSIQSEDNITDRPSSRDIDVVAKVGPTIQKHISELEDLCKLVPNNNGVLELLDNLKKELSSKIQLQSNMLESENSVIYRLDKDNPMDNSEILVLGGAGRYPLKMLRNKAAREARQLAQDLAVDHPDYASAVLNVKQTANTINTIAKAVKELEGINKPPVAEVEEIPDEIGVAPEVTTEDVNTMYETMFPVLGETTWTAISKKLATEGLKKETVRALVDSAIIARSK